jgi:hypothetical protein
MPVRLVKACYGLTNAPRAWWLSVCAAFEKAGLLKLRTDGAAWRVVGGSGETVGLVVAHVDDFLLVGDHNNEYYMKARTDIEQSFRWSPWQRGEFTYAGVRIRQRLDYGFVLDQQQYLESLEPYTIPDYRLADDSALLDAREISAMRGLLGAVQWPAVQSSPQACAELSLLQSSLSAPTVADLKATSRLLKYIKKDPARTLVVDPLGHVSWDEVVLVQWADAAVAYRPDLGSTGGLVTGLTAPSFATGKLVPVTLVQWSCRKLRRVARSSLSAEVQSIAEGADPLWLVRLQWVEMNGIDCSSGREDAAVRQVPGILVTDAKSVYDAVTRNETQGLGLSEKQSALELLGVKEQIARDGTDLRWVHSAAQLADGLTKAAARHVIELFLRTGTWAVKHDPAFESAEIRQKSRKAVFADMVGRLLEQMAEPAA